MGCDIIQSEGVAPGFWGNQLQNLEDGSIRFLWNNTCLPGYMGEHPRRLQSSCPILLAFFQSLEFIFQMIAAISSLLSTCGHCSDKLNQACPVLNVALWDHKIIIEDKPPVGLLCLLILIPWLYSPARTLDTFTTGAHSSLLFEICLHLFTFSAYN
jgi:hypothetical protein